MINIAVLGFGNIGSGVVELVDSNSSQIKRAIPEGLYVKHILDIRSFPQSPYCDRITDDFEKIISDPDIRVICETMGGKEPARTFTMRALEKGISVCTSNKELVEAFGPELIRIARENNCSYLFEASVGGGIPLLHPLITCLGQERITAITGILNGTTNYILTNMERFGASYEDVLREAQERGYAERDPRADVEGHDAGRKIAILASLMTGKTVQYASLPIEGITSIKQVDFAFAHEIGCTVRLLGTAFADGENISVMVAPYLISTQHMLASVQDVFNAVIVHGQTVDDLMFYGRGAGKNPTASAVLSDVIAAASHAGSHLPILWSAETLDIADPGDAERQFMTRLPAAQFGNAERVFEGYVEKKLVLSTYPDEAAFITKAMPERDYMALRSKIGSNVHFIRLF